MFLMIYLRALANTSRCCRCAPISVAHFADSTNLQDALYFCTQTEKLANLSASHNDGPSSKTIAPRDLSNASEHPVKEISIKARCGPCFAATSMIESVESVSHYSMIDKIPHNTGKTEHMHSVSTSCLSNTLL